MREMKIRALQMLEIGLTKPSYNYKKGINMYFKQKLAYMGLGCVFTLAGYFLATLGAGGTNLQTASAQDTEKQVVNEIVCRKLRVVSPDDVTVARLEAFRTGGAGIVLYNKEGEQVFWVSSSGEGSTLSMFNEAGERTIWIWSASHGGGHLLLCNDAGTKLFGVRSYDVVDDEFDFGGGLLQLYNRVGNSLVKINGKNGEVTTWDKQGNETGRLPR